MFTKGGGVDRLKKDVSLWGEFRVLVEGSERAVLGGFLEGMASEVIFLLLVSSFLPATVSSRFE